MLAGLKMVFDATTYSDKHLDVIFNADVRMNILTGAVRSGKTYASFFAIARMVGEFPINAKILFVGKTERTLYRNILNPMIEIFGSRVMQYRKGSGEGSFFGRTFYTVGANDERSQDKIRGMTLDLAYCDEVTLYPESFFTMLLSRLSTKGAKLLGTTNPDSPYHWLRVNYLDREDELDLKSWHFLLEDNINLDPAYVKSLKQEYTGLWYKRFILGLWVLAEGAVYDMFDEDKHAAKPVPPIEHYTDIYTICDYGTTNPCVFLMFGISPDYKRYLIKEYYFDSREAGYQKTDSQYADDYEQFVEGVDQNAMIVDPSAASFIAELKSRGVYVLEANNEVLPGIMETSTELEDGRIIIDPSCVNTIKEFSGYVWDKKASERGEDKPIKTSDHAMDCIRYFVHTVQVDEGVEYAGSPVTFDSGMPQF